MKKIITIALYIIIIMGVFFLLLDLASSKFDSVLAYLFWLAISALFIERIRRGKIGKWGLIFAGIWVTLFALGFSAGVILVLLAQ